MFSAPRAERAETKYLICSGRRMCSILVDALPTVEGGLRFWVNVPREGPGQFSVECGDEARKGGCSLRKLKLVKAVRVPTRVARRVLDVDNDELVWMARAYHSFDEVRGLSNDRKSGPRAARPLVQGCDASPESVDH